MFDDLEFCNVQRVSIIFSISCALKYVLFGFSCDIGRKGALRKRHTFTAYVADIFNFEYTFVFIKTVIILSLCT